MRYKGNKLILTPLTKNIINEGNYKNWFLDPEIILYSSHGRKATTDEDIAFFIKEANNDRTITWAIIRNYDKNHIGNIALQLINFIDRNAELAIIIGDTKSWGKGYGTEACRLVINHAFEKLNLNRVYLGTMDPNVGMKKIAEKLHMTLEGKSREAFWLNEEYTSICHYAILRKEWKKDYSINTMPVKNQSLRIYNSLSKEEIVNFKSRVSYLLNRGCFSEQITQEKALNSINKKETWKQFITNIEKEIKNEEKQ